MGPVTKRVEVAALAIACWLALGAAMSGQKGPPPQDDPEVYYSFFVVMDGFGQWLDERVQAKPARRSELMDSAGRYWHIKASELPKVLAECRAAVAEVKAIEAQSQAYWKGEIERGHAPESAKVRQYGAMRQSAIQAGRIRLQQALLSSSWNGLHARINGEHRLSMQRNR